jgi:hypothetical protein
MGFAASHDGLGHVALRVRLDEGVYNRAWRAEVTLEFDAGQLDTLARDAEHFEAT